MNKIAVSLYVIGVFAIIGGIVVGFSTYQTPVDGYKYLTEENYPLLLGWIGAGVVSGIMLFGFAEIINLLDRIKSAIVKDEEEVKPVKESKGATKAIEDILNK